MWLWEGSCVSEKSRLLAPSSLALFWSQTRRLWKPRRSRTCQRSYSPPWRLLFVTRMSMCRWQPRYANTLYSHIILLPGTSCRLSFWRVSNSITSDLGIWGKERTSYHQLFLILSSSLSCSTVYRTGFVFMLEHSKITFPTRYFYKIDTLPPSGTWAKRFIDGSIYLETMPFHASIFSFHWKDDVTISKILPEN